MDFQLDRTLDILRQTPATITSLLADLSDPWVKSDEGPGTWTPFDIVGHLIHGEETDWIPRLQIILTYGESRPFTPFNRFAQFEKSRGKSLAVLLETFRGLRERNLQVVADLDLGAAELQRSGTHPELGPVTARQLLATWAVHDLSHIAQVARTLARAYSAEVGPWCAYLRILSDA